MRGSWTSLSPHGPCLKALMQTRYTTTVSTTLTLHLSSERNQGLASEPALFDFYISLNCTVLNHSLPLYYKVIL